MTLAYSLIRHHRSRRYIDIGLCTFMCFMDSRVDYIVLDESVLHIAQPSSPSQQVD